MFLYRLKGFPVTFEHSKRSRRHELLYQADRVQQHIPADPVDADVLVDRKGRVERVLTCCFWQVTLGMTLPGISGIPCTGHGMV